MSAIYRISNKLLINNMKSSLPSITCLAILSIRGFAIATDVTKEDKIRGAFYSALIADALCLGSHYEYDAPKIKQAYNGIIDEYMAPGEQMGGQTHGVGWGARNYHPGTVKGDQTDYGEYNVLVLEHLAQGVDIPHSFDVSEFIPLWQQRLTNGWKVCLVCLHFVHMICSYL